MYTVLALGVFLAVGLGLTFLPYRFPALCEKGIRFVRRRVLSGRSQAVFEAGKAHELASIFWFRVWAAIAVMLLVTVGIGYGATAEEDPQTVAHAGLLAAGSLGLAGLATFGLLAAVYFVPRARAFASLREHGFGALWVLNRDRHPQRLHEGLENRAHTSNAIRILDVTGYDFLGKGPGASGGLLYDTLAAMSGVPARLLLLDPSAQVPDPEQKHASVYQTLLGEMKITPAAYRRQLRATLDTVEALNEKRISEAKIEVRYYAEKPAFRMVLLDQLVLVGPWNVKEEGVPLPLLEIEKSCSGRSLYEGFRRQFARLWRGSTARERAEESRRAAQQLQVARAQETAQRAKSPSSVVRRRPTPEAVA